MADGLDIGALAGRVEFEDHTSATLDLIVKRLDELDEKWSKVDHTVADSAKGFLAAEVSLKAVEGALSTVIGVVKDLTINGSGIASVTDNFANLAAQSGHLSEVLLSDVRQGTHSTIADLDLIKTLSGDLAAGLKLTDQEFGDLAEGAFRLAQATGGDVKEAFDSLNQAMLTGQVRAVSAKLGKIDLAQAEQDLARKLGTTADRLNEEGKLQAARIAILERVREASKRLGEQEDGVGEIVAQAQTRWSNFYNTLASGVATSPGVTTAFRNIDKALEDTFGDKNGEAIKNITGAIDGFARVVAQIGPPTIGFLGKIASGFGWFAEGLADDISTGQDIVANLALVVQGYSFTEAYAMVQTQKTTEAMILQADAAKKQADATRQADEAAKAQAAQQADIAKRQERNRMIIAETNEEIKKRKDAMEEINSVTNTYGETVAKMDQDMVKAIKSYLEAGVAQDKLATAYGLTATQITAIVKVMKDEDTAMKLAAKQASDSEARWSAFYATRIEMSGRATDMVIADIKRWEAAQIKSHIDAKTDTADFYAWLTATSKQAQEKADQERLQADEHSKAYFEMQKVRAQDTYDFALQHADQFTSGYIDGLRKTKEAAEDAALHWEDSIGKELDNLVDRFDRLKEAMEFGGSFEITSQNFAEALHKNNTFGGWSQIGHFDEAQGYALARKGYSFEEIISILNAQSTHSGPIPPPKGPRIPGFRDGGVGDFGAGTLAVLHGKEAIVPLERDGMVGGVVNHFHINGTAEDTAYKIFDILMLKYRMGRQIQSS